MGSAVLSLEQCAPVAAARDELSVRRRKPRPRVRPSAASYLRELSPPMQKALVRAHTLGIPVDDPRSVGVQRRTVDVLEEHRLLEQRDTRKGKRVWRPSVRGRELLTRDEPRLLRPRGGYTADPSQALRDEPEAVDDFQLAAGARAAEHRETDRFDALLLERRRLPLLERLRLAQVDAERRGIQIDRPLHVIEQRVEAIERQVYRPADRATES